MAVSKLTSQKVYTSTAIGLVLLSLAIPLLINLYPIMGESVVVLMSDLLLGAAIASPVMIVIGLIIYRKNKGLALPVSIAKSGIGFSALILVIAFVDYIVLYGVNPIVALFTNL